MIEWATNGQAARQRSARQETTMFKAGTLPLNMYRTSDFPKDKVSFSPNTAEEQPVTSATTEMPSTSHEAIEESQVVEETDVEEKEEYDTDSDSDDPSVDNDEEDTLDDLMFLRAVTTRSGRMVRVVFRE